MCQIRVKKSFLLIFGCIFALVCLASAAVLVGKYHRLTHIVLDSAGGKIASSSYRSRSSIGQRFVGETESTICKNLCGYIRLSEEGITGEVLRVVSTLPEDDGYFIIWQDTDIKIIFNKEMSSSTVVPANIQIQDEFGEDLPLTKVVYADFVITITPSQEQMNYCARYTIKLSTNVVDVYGNSLIEEERFSFTTLIAGSETGKVRVEHKEDILKVENPSETFPRGSKGYYINLMETDIRSLDKYVESTARVLRCYGVDVDEEGKQGDINQLDRPVNISIPYPPDTKDKKNLKLYFHNKEINRWELVKGSGDTNPDDKNYYVIGEVRITNTEYCVRGFAMGGLIEEYSNYPNPFKAGKQETTIIYDLEEAAKVTISIYDLLGQLVRRIEIRKETPEKGVQGTNKVPWNGKNERGRVVANGGYYCVVEADTETGKHMKKVRKIMVIK